MALRPLSLKDDSSLLPAIFTDNGCNLASMDSAQFKKGGVLVLQASFNLSYGLLMAACRKPEPGKEVFFGPSAVLLFESIKFLASICGVIYEKYGEVQSLEQHGSTDESAPMVSSSGYTKLASEADAEKVPGENFNASFKIDEEFDEDQTIVEESQKLHASAYSAQQSSERASLDNDAKRLAETYERDDDHLEGREGTWQRVYSLVRTELFCLSAFRLSIPAILYVIQNNLFFFSAGYLTATEFQTFSQTKLITTAVLSVLILGKELNVQHWLAILLLIAGIIDAQLSAIPRNTTRAAVEAAHAAISADHALETAKNMLSSPEWRTLVGIATILLACTFSGLAAVLLEKLYKGKRSFWTLNVHLSFFSLIPAFVPVFADAIKRHNFEPLRNFTPLVWLLVLVNAGGGFVVALVLRYADNILKGFAVSAALVATMLISAFVTKDTYFSALELAGMVAIVASMFIYGRA